MNGRSLLHYAADAGDFDVLKELVNHGANVNVKKFKKKNFHFEIFLHFFRVKINLG